MTWNKNIIKQQCDGLTDRYHTSLKTVISLKVRNLIKDKTLALTLHWLFSVLLITTLIGNMFFKLQKILVIM